MTLHQVLLWGGFNLFVVAMLALDSAVYPIPIAISLSVIASVLALSVAASMIWPRKEEVAKGKC